jgi:hypothetical protein
MSENYDLIEGYVYMSEGETAFGEEYNQEVAVRQRPMGSPPNVRQIASDDGLA